MQAPVSASPVIRNAVLFGCVGLASGILVWLVISFVWESLIGLDTHATIAGWDLSIGHLTLVPGFVFGNAVGLALVRFGLAGSGRALAYIGAATLANFIATNFAANMVDAVESAALLGMSAGLVGAACLTGLTLLLFPFARHLRPCLWMVAAGTALGALLHVAIEDNSSWGRGFLLLYAFWQAGYGATLGAALPRRSPA
jgi:hypothetical protein